MKKLIFLITLIACSLSCGPDLRDECQFDSDCASWQECSAHKCLDKPTHSTAPVLYPADTQVVSCNCNYTADAPGTIRSDARCASGQNVSFLCNGCCSTNTYGYCIGYPWGRVCS